MSALYHLSPFEQEIDTLKASAQSTKTGRHFKDVVCEMTPFYMGNSRLNRAQVERNLERLEEVLRECKPKIRHLDEEAQLNGLPVLELSTNQDAKWGFKPPNVWHEVSN